MARQPAPCRRCRIIQLYLMVALPLIGIMAFAPQGLSRIAPALPSPKAIAALIVLGGIATFVIRLVRWHRDGRH